MIKPYSYKKSINFITFNKYYKIHIENILLINTIAFDKVFTQPTRNTVELLINIKINQNLMNKSYSS